MRMKEKSNLSDRVYEYWFACIRGISGERKYCLRKWFHSARDIYNIEETDFSKSGMTEKERDILYGQRKLQVLEEAEEKVKRMEKQGICMLLRGEDAYPAKLTQISAAPYALFVKGNPLPLCTGKCMAVVGARVCTDYGRRYAARYARELAGAGVGIVSGMAHGVDGAAHRGALDAGGYTAAILGCGVDICYPREHIGLYEDILRKGGSILSEYPPGTPPLPKHFPARNRIISGLSDAVLVMEAGERSGSFITVDRALEQGKDVYALPGPADSRLSLGCHELIRQGAGILITPESLLEEAYGIMTYLSEKSKQKKIMLESRENMVYSCLRLNPRSLQQLSQETGIEIKELMECLVSLELSGAVEEVSKNYYRTCE